MSKIVSFLTSGTPWAIQQSALDGIIHIAKRENNLEAVLQERGGRLENTRRVEMRDGVAVMYVTGPLFPRANLFAEISGAMSVEMLALDLAEAERNDDVRAVVMVYDTPGGYTTMINEFAQQISEFKKPVVAYVTGQASSAGYWLAAPADKIVLDATALVGSVGVVAAYSAKKDGDYQIVSSNAPDKRPDMETDDGKAVVQSMVDDMETVFIDAVMNFRGMTREQVIGLRGGVVIGAKAIESGFADELGSLEGVISQLQEENPMDLDALKADHPDTYQAAVNVGVAQANTENESVAASANSEATTSERKRISAITTCDEAEGRADMANHIAFETEMSADDAKKMLAAAPVKAEGDSFGAMDAEMDADGNPVVSSDSESGAEGFDADLKLFNKVGEIK